MSEIKIRCPHCSWEPDGGAHWACTCDHVWNTFDTAGVCPACNKKWEDTQCPVPDCQKWSKHEDWYIIPIDMEALFATKKNVSAITENDLHQINLK